MIRRPPRSTLSSSSAASDVYKRQTLVLNAEYGASFTGYDDDDLDVRLTVDRARQMQAIAAHASQAVPSSVLWRRLELQGDQEFLRALHREHTETSDG